MIWFERLLIWVSTRFVNFEVINSFFRSPQNTAVLLGSMIAIAGGILGTFLLLRGMSLTSDAISHTVLLGIVVAFMIMIAGGFEPSLSSPWLLIGAALAGVGTVVLTELIHRSGLVKQDAALGLAFPLLFAIAVIFVSRYVDDVHLDQDSVMLGEIGVAWANTNSYSFGESEPILITEDDPRAEIANQCVNCRTEGISPRDPGAQFAQICTNCGEYSPAQAYQLGYTDVEPVLVFWPESITVMFAFLLITLLFVLIFYKELKLSTFDPALAKSLGMRPTLLLYALMTLVSLVAVGAFDAVGSVLVVAFFIIPAATAYLLTDRLPVMLMLSAVFGSAGAYFGYDLARGRLFGYDFTPLFRGNWDTSISAAMVVMMLVFFILALLISPRYGILSSVLKLRLRKSNFEEHVLLGHVLNHSGTPEEAEELALETLCDHVKWPQEKVQRVYRRLRGRAFVALDDGTLRITDKGRKHVSEFWGQPG